MRVHNTTADIEQIIEDAERLQNTLTALETAALQEAPKNYETLAMDAAMRGERLAVRLRDVVFSSTVIGRRRYLRESADTLGIIADFDGDVLSLMLPGQLPKRRWKNSEFLTQPLMAAMAELRKRKVLPRLTDAAVCFVHVIDDATPTRYVRDHDNIECKQILDVIGASVLTDDNGLLCETHHRTERGAFAHTEVFVMPKTRFAKWFIERENRKNDPHKIEKN